MADLTVVGRTLVRMALFTLNHLHGRYTVSGDKILSVLREFLLFRDVPVTPRALQSLSLVRRVGEVNVVRLPCVDFPGYFAIFLDVVAYKLRFVLAAPLGGFMAFLAPVNSGNPTVRAVGTQAVA